MKHIVNCNGKNLNLIKVKLTTTSLRHTGE